MTSIGVELCLRPQCATQLTSNDSLRRSSDAVILTGRRWSLRPA